MQACWYTVVIRHPELDLARMEATAFMNAVISAHVAAGAPDDVQVFRLDAGDDGVYVYLTSPGLARIAASTLKKHGAAPVAGEPDLTGLQPVSF